MIAQNSGCLGIYTRKPDLGSTASKNSTEVGKGYRDNIVLSSDSCPILDVFNSDEIIASLFFVFLCFLSRRQLD